MPAIQIIDTAGMSIWAKLIIAVCYFGIAIVLVIPFIFDLFKKKKQGHR